MDPEQKQEPIADPNMTLGNTKVIAPEKPAPTPHMFGLKRPILFYASGFLIIGIIILLTIILILRMIQVFSS